jgi:signal transduction histidine kinase
LAHELNQPLSVIAGCTQACLKQISSNPDQGHGLLSYLEQAAQQADRANEIIHQVRGLIQKEHRKRDRIDLNQTILGVADLLRSDAREHGAALRLDLADALPPVIADPFQVQQVVLNLAHNGIQAMGDLPASSRQITIHTVPGDDGKVEIVVRDAGNEIAPQTLERMFEPFFTTKTTGLGMGLSLCRSIAEAHGGNLWVKSDRESRTEFHFVLPAAGEIRSDVA